MAFDDSTFCRQIYDLLKSKAGSVDQRDRRYRSVLYALKFSVCLRALLPTGKRHRQGLQGTCRFGYVPVLHGFCSLWRAMSADNIELNDQAEDR
jgi:hypothetical protein